MLVRRRTPLPSLASARRRYFELAMILFAGEAPLGVERRVDAGDEPCLGNELSRAFAQILREKPCVIVEQAGARPRVCCARAGFCTSSWHRGSRRLTC